MEFGKPGEYLTDEALRLIDLAPQRPDKAAALLKQLHDWRTQVGAAMLTPNPAFQ